MTNIFSNPKREKVAKALYYEEPSIECSYPYDVIKWEKVQEHERDYWRKMAQVAIAAGGNAQ